MSEPKKVIGSECLNWVDKPIGFVDKTGARILDNDNFLAKYFISDSYYMYMTGEINDYVSLTRFHHNTNKRIVGYVTNQYDDGGYRVVLLGDEDIELSNTNNCRQYYHHMKISSRRKYAQGLVEIKVKKDGTYNGLPYVPFTGDTNTGGLDVFLANESSYALTLDETIDYHIDIDSFGAGTSWVPNCIHSGTITNDPSTTLIFGDSAETNIDVVMYDELVGNPLVYLQGELYDLATDKCLDMESEMPYEFIDISMFSNWRVVSGKTLNSMNYCAVPYNIILTNSLQFAQMYLNDGTLPPDAFLFPLDWDALPSYVPDDTPDDDVTPDDDPDNNGGFDGDPDLPVAPFMTPSKASNNNYYWLQPAQLQGFINWFWEDVGAFSDFDDIINKVMGLYNDLASTVLSIRYMPAPMINNDPAYCFGGLGTDSNIKVGMIEKNGAVHTLAKENPPIIDIGHVKVPKDYNSFASYTPYASCSLYLPYYGFMDIDMDMFTGHEIYVKAIYDHITGTIQYLIYYENKYLVNSVVCKMAVDIPITLQSKNDRDSAIFQNVSNAVAGLMSAGTTIATGNPLGLVVGASALTSGVHSAPLSVKGTVGESGAFYAPSKCKLIVRFPVEQKPSKFSQICGKQLNKTMKLNNSNLGGFTQCHNPRITFKNTSPYQSEIDEIYDYLEKGVIL